MPNTTVDARVLADRLTQRASGTYIQIGDLIKSGVLAIAAVSLADIMSDTDATYRIVFFSYSVIAIFTSYITWHRGQMLAPVHLNILDYLFPVLMGINEYVLFLVLTSNFTFIRYDIA